MNIIIDEDIFTRQKYGGISTLWRNLIPHLEAALPDCTFTEDLRIDVWVSTYYYNPEYAHTKSVIMVYDWIAEQYAPIGAHHPDAIEKHRAVKSADAIIAISQHVATDTLRFGGRKATVAYPGTNMTRADDNAIAAFCERHHLTPNSYVLVVGRRHLYKNVRSLYQAYPFFNRPDMPVLCIGGEQATAEDASFAARHNWRQLELPDTDMAAAYSGAAMLVYPSLMEGFGLPVLEAMACGCPVVCGANTSLVEVAGDAAFYADVHRPHSIAAAMNQALDAGQRVEKAIIGYSQARQFTWEHMAKTVAQAIREVIA